MRSTMFLLIAMSLVVEYAVIQAKPAEYWPAQCKGKSYCDQKPKYYPDQRVKELMEDVSMDYTLGDFQNRSAGEDVASCERIYRMTKIYLIKDENDTIRFVPQTDKFKISIAIEECRYPGEVFRPEYLKKQELKNHRVECIQKMVPFIFPVVSLNKKSLDTAAPKNGISMGCSGKIMKSA